MSEETKIVYKREGVGFCSLLGLLFIALKLTGIIAWSWWFVLAPLYVPIAIGIVAYTGFFVVGLIVLVVGVILALVFENLGKKKKPYLLQSKPLDARNPLGLTKKKFTH